MTVPYSSEALPNGYTSSAPYTNGHSAPSMDGRQAEYPQSGLDPNKQTNEKDQISERPLPTSDHPSAAHYTPQQDVKFNPSAAATPTGSEYSLNPSSARSGTFPDYVHRGYPDASQQQQHQQHQRYPQHPTSTPNGATPGNMAHPQSPSMPLVDGQSGDSHRQPPRDTHSNHEIPVDPSIAASSPTYPPSHHYSPYPPTHDMPQYHTPPMYPRPEYGAAYSAPPHGMPGPYGHPATSVSTPPSMVSAGARPPGVSLAYVPHPTHTHFQQGGHPLSTVYSFVPIPGTHQQKRPRRRYEEIERMYKCGWNGCEKAYGTLNHLNAHVTMQSHGPKRTPEEFKEIRKEWKARKKEEENQRKADEERQRQAVQQQGGQPGEGQHNPADGGAQQNHSSSGYPQAVRQLPPIGYTPAGGQVPAQYGQQPHAMEGMPQYPGGQVQPAYGYPQSPYGQSQMYQQRFPPSQAHPAEQNGANSRATDENAGAGFINGPK